MTTLQTFYYVYTAVSRSPFCNKIIYIFYIATFHWPFAFHCHYLFQISFHFHAKIDPSKKKKKGCHQVLVLLHRIVCTGIANETPPQTVFSFPINTSREGKAIFISYNLSCHKNAPFYRAVAGVET